MAICLGGKAKIQIHKFLHGDMNNPDKLLKPIPLLSIKHHTQSKRKKNPVVCFPHSTLLTNFLEAVGVDLGELLLGIHILQEPMYFVIRYIAWLHDITGDLSSL